ncbi:hypothetical protein ZHAS_00015866 [Anopheles sinensis]|uniref:Uncharacterized protein n=1 Tax=Anopheles sinensis TaxID=74873 RepID=A0A084WC48_ANOSI|nr:hypothetical protein ZHAS_00015866 [Anopheles sinensis]
MIVNGCPLSIRLPNVNIIPPLPDDGGGGGGGVVVEDNHKSDIVRFAASMNPASASRAAQTERPNTNNRTG